MKFWTSIDDLPIYNYYKFIESKDLNWLIYEQPTKKVDEDWKKEQLFKAWQIIELEFYGMMVNDPDYISELKKQLRKRSKRIDALLRPDAFYKTLWEVEKLKDNEAGNEFDYSKSIAMLEKYLKFAVDDKTMSVRRYFSHYNMMKNGK